MHMYGYKPESRKEGWKREMVRLPVVSLFAFLTWNKDLIMGPRSPQGPRTSHLPITPAQFPAPLEFLRSGLLLCLLAASFRCLDGLFLWSGLCSLGRTDLFHLRYGFFSFFDSWCIFDAITRKLLLYCPHKPFDFVHHLFDRAIAASSHVIVLSIYRRNVRQQEHNHQDREQ